MANVQINKHSPGPWHPGHLGDDSIDCECAHIVDEGYMGGIATVHINNGKKSIADGWNDCPPREEAIANMHLIAASPDLLDSVDMVYDLLDNLEGFFEDGDTDGYWETIAVIRTNLRWVRKKARNEIKK
jgi:hypothetical protein